MMRGASSHRFSAGRHACLITATAPRRRGWWCGSLWGIEDLCEGISRSRFRVFSNLWNDSEQFSHRDKIVEKEGIVPGRRLCYYYLKTCFLGVKIMYYAHIRADGTKQTVEAHLNGTAERCASFAAAFGEEQRGKLLGYAHDIGKCSKAFQHRLQGGPKVDHATAGGLECAKVREILFYAIWCAVYWTYQRVQCLYRIIRGGMLHG